MHEVFPFFSWLLLVAFSAKHIALLGYLAMDKGLELHYHVLRDTLLGSQ
jgi:hypothetical protein